MAGVPRSSYLVLSGRPTCDAVHYRGAGQIHRSEKRSLLHAGKEGFVWIKQANGGEDCGETIWAVTLLNATRRRVGDGRMFTSSLGSLRRWHDGPTALFVARATHDDRVLIRSMHRVGRATVRSDARVEAQPSFLFGFTRIDELIVVSIFPRSPLRVIAEFKEVLVHERCSPWPNEAPESLVAKQSKQGLLNNLEIALHENFGIVCPDDSTIANDRNNSMALDMVTRYVPEPTEDLAERILIYRLDVHGEPFMLDNGSDVDVDATLDVGERTDQQVA